MTASTRNTRPAQDFDWLAYIKSHLRHATEEQRTCVYTWLQQYRAKHDGRTRAK